MLMFETERIRVILFLYLLSSLHCFHASPTSPSEESGANEGPLGKYGVKGIKESKSVKVEESGSKMKGIGSFSGSKDSNENFKLALQYSEMSVSKYVFPCFLNAV